MFLTMHERLVLLSCLPAEGSFTTLKIVHELRMGLAPTAQEYEACEMQEKDGRVIWKQALAPDKDIALGGPGLALLVEALQKLDTEKKLTESHYSIYEKIMCDGQADGPRLVGKAG